jgi:hypothetical protein
MVSTMADEPITPGRSDVRQAVEAAARAEAQALRAHRQAMVLSLRAALAHERAALVAGQVGLVTQASLHEGLADRARGAARGELVPDGVDHPAAVVL